MMKGVWRQIHFLLAFGSALFLFLASVSGFILGIEALLDQTKPQSIESLEDYSLKTTLEALDANIKEVFAVSKVGKVAGCIVTEGTIKKGSKVRLLRDDVVIHEGDLSQLKRFKDDVKDVREGTECGAAFANYQDIQVGDRIECFELEQVAVEL